MKRLFPIPGCFQGRFYLIIFLTFQCMLSIDAWAGELPKPNESGPIPGMFVNTYTGNLFYQQSDLLIPGKGFSLEASFSYNSAHSKRNHGFGNGWSSSFSMGYRMSGDTLVIEHADGNEDAYVWNGTSYTAPPGVYNDLTESSDGEFVLHTKHGIKFYFSNSAHKRITKIEDRNGNTLSFTYSSGKLLHITDASGRKLDFTWTGEHLTQLTDPNSVPERIIMYHYDPEGNLSELVDGMGNSTLYTYNEKGKMTGITNARSTEIQISYEDRDNNPVSGIRCQAVGYEMGVSYNQSAATTTISKKAHSGTLEVINSFDDGGRIVKITQADQSTRSFTWDAHNNITRFENENGNATDYAYDSKGNLIRESDCFGNTNEFTYSDEFSQLLSETDKNGNTYIYTYDNQGNLLETKDPLGNLTVFTYDGFGNMLTSKDGNGNTYSYMVNDHGYITQITDPLGNAEKYSYDQTGSKISSESKNGDMYTYMFDILGRIIQRTDPLGNFTSFSFDAVGNLVSTTNRNNASTSYTYDALNRLSSITNALGFAVTSSFDGLGNLTSSTDNMGNTQTYEYNARNWKIKSFDPLGNVHTSSFDAIGNLTSSTDENGNTTSYTYDCLDRQISMTDPGNNTEQYSYDPIGNRIAVKNKNGFSTNYAFNAINQNTSITDALGHTEKFSYDSNGNKLSHVDRNGNTTTYTYDEMNQLTGVVDPSGYTEALAYDAEGNLLSQTDKNGHTTRHVYDVLDRRIETIDPDAVSELYQFDSEGNLLLQTDKNGNSTGYAFNLLNQLISSTDPLGFAEIYSYDPNGNMVSHSNKNGDLTLYVFDETDQMISVTLPLGGMETFTYDPAGKLLAETDKSGNTTRYTYDCCRLSSLTNPLGNTEHYSYDAEGNLISNVDMKGNETQYVYDGLNRMVKMTDANMNETSYAYNPNGNKLKETSPKENEISYEYDDRNLVVKMRTPLGNETVIKYDGNGNIVEEIKPDGSKKISEYDVLNRAVKINYDSDNRSMEYAYDAMGNITQISTNTGDEKGIITKAYDGRNQLISITNDFNGNFTKEIQYEYDKSGNRISMIADGEKVGYSFNAGNQMTGITNKYDELTSYEYDQSNRRTKKTFGNGMYALYSHDKSGNLLSLIYYHDTGWLIASFFYTYDKNGNRLSADEVIPSFTGRDTTAILYAYDDLNQLISEAMIGGSSTEYVYDEDRNRIWKTTDQDSTYSSYDADGRLLTSGSIMNMWDNNGNLTSRIEGTNTTYYSYNYPNKLTEVLLPGGDTVTYDWSGEWHRMGKTASPTAWSLTDCQPCPICCGCHENVLGRYSSDAQEWNHVTMGATHDEITSQRLWEYTFYHITDGLGSTRCIIDSWYYLAGRTDYDAYGVKIREEDELYGHNYFQFAGRTYDPQFGQYYFRARSYDPGTGSFTTRDPLWREILVTPSCGTNPNYRSDLPFAYVGNNPASNLDPSGLNPVGAFFKGVYNSGRAMGNALGYVLGVTEYDLQLQKDHNPIMKAEKQGGWVEKSTKASVGVAGAAVTVAVAAAAAAAAAPLVLASAEAALPAAVVLPTALALATPTAAFTAKAVGVGLVVLAGTETYASVLRDDWEGVGANTVYALSGASVFRRLGGVNFRRTPSMKGDFDSGRWFEQPNPNNWWNARLGKPPAPPTREWKPWTWKPGKTTKLDRICTPGTRSKKDLFRSADTERYTNPGRQDFLDKCGQSTAPHPGPFVPKPGFSSANTLH